MPRINRIRVNNVKYNFGTQAYDDFTMRLYGQNTLYDLANGGGKSVLMLLLMQCMIPNCTLDDKQPLGPVMDAIRDAAGSLLEDIRLFDIFRGVQLGLGKKSAAFSLVFRSPDQTLTDDTLNPIMKKVLKVCKEQFDAEIRS